jgi:hypothetical protein
MDTRSDTGFWNSVSSWIKSFWIGVVESEETQVDAEMFKHADLPQRSPRNQYTDPGGEGRNVSQIG